MKTAIVQFVRGTTAILLLSASLAYAVNDETNYVGDKLVYSFIVHATYADAPQDPVCIPANTTLLGMGSTTGKLYVQVKKKGLKQCNDDSKEIASDRVLEIDLKTPPLDIASPGREGLTYGALVVPYKYFYSGSKDFLAGSTVGPYFGYRLSRQTIGFETKFIVFLGATTASVSQTSGGQTSNQNLAGFSYGFGMITEIKKSFQLGFVLGIDRVSDSIAYPNSGQPWAAISIGFDFGQ